MQLELGFRHLRSSDLQPEHILVRGRPVQLHLVRNRRARHYVLRLRSDGAARVTIPRGGSAERVSEYVSGAQSGRSEGCAEAGRRETRRSEAGCFQGGRAQGARCT